MTVIEFCKNFKELTKENKEKEVAKIVKTTYAPFLTKMLLCKAMAEKSLSLSDKGISYIDMCTNKINFTAMVISLYTTLEYTKDEKGKPETAKCYDALRECKAIDYILEIVGDDIQELLTINQDCIESVYNEHCSLEAFVGKQVEKISFIFSAMSDGVLKEISKELQGMNVEQLQSMVSSIDKDKFKEVK